MPQPMSLRHGKIFLDGETVMEAVSFEAVFTPDIIERRVLNQRGVKRRWNGYDITGTITNYRVTAWAKNKIKYYLDTGKTPYFTITGYADDPDSTYVTENGKDEYTFTNATLTGDISLLNLDAEGDELQDELEFGAEEVILAS